MNNDKYTADNGKPESEAASSYDIAEMPKKPNEERAELEKREKDVSALENNLNARKNALDALDSELAEREFSIAQSEQDIAHKKQQLDKELQMQSLQAHTQLERELAAIRAKRMQTIIEEISQESESLIKKAKEQLTKIINDAAKEAERIKSEAVAKAKDVVDQAAAKQAKLEQKEADLNGEKAQIECKKRRIDRHSEELENKEQELEELKSEKLDELKKDYEAKLSAKDESLRDLREQLKNQIREKEQYESLRASLGEDPSVIQGRIQEYLLQIQQLREDVASRPSKEAADNIKNERDQYKKAQEELVINYNDLFEKYNNLADDSKKLHMLEIENEKLENKNKELNSLVEELKSSNENYLKRIKRLSVSEADISDREARIREIKKGYLPVLTGAGLPMGLSETEWLDNIYKQCEEYGIHFPRRILYAFHTALKISDWSSITVLAGVSGTGKSELPRLYAAFGGMNFINVPVQPSWDSQESMLGFFNSIDNRFEPEPLLRFLVQCTEDPEYSKYMSVILLDEMNLAHVEHYFADFLSKLETRRGLVDVPSIEVKLGAGVDPYQLKLERNLLWTGTMNQDETTKSLSDKVLDRGLVINFPRPRILISRKGMRDLDKFLAKLNRPMLTKKTWEDWIKKTVDLTGDQAQELSSYKKIVEDINDNLELVGRALGHRVWQSIEHYIVNYPTAANEMKNSANGEMSDVLRKNMKTAFEDQIVQKIMPKLRGVETRGKSKDSLDKIKSLLENNGFETLIDDFNTACEQGYGQFIWSSAKYIEDDEKTAAPEAESGAEGSPAEPNAQ